MTMGRMSLAICAEINIVADGTLVANAGNIALCRLVLAQGTVAKDAIVDLDVTGLVTDSSVDRRKPMARVVNRGVGVTVGTEVPVRASQALVADAKDRLELSVSWRLPIISKHINMWFLTFSPPSQMAACLNWRPGRQRDMIKFFKQKLRSEPRWKVCAGW